MNRCLCCGQALDGTECINGWHVSCIKKFFVSSSLPDLDLSEEVLLRLAKESTGKGLTVPGVQKKISLHLSKENRLTLVNYPTGFILKPPVDRFPYMPESEHMVMLMANACGIKTVPHALIQYGKGYAYICKRIDRIIAKGIVKKLAMEDFCQLSGRLTNAKYRGSYESCRKIISSYSSYCGYDLTEFFMRIVFCYLTGNSDMHFKNFSLIQSDNDPSCYSLSPAYDLLPVNILLKADTEEVALTLNGKKRNLVAKDFLKLGTYLSLDLKVTKALIKHMLDFHDAMIDIVQFSLVSDEFKNEFIELMNERYTKLSVLFE